MEIELKDLYALDSWLSALRHGRVIPQAYYAMSDEDQQELERLCTLMRTITRKAERDLRENSIEILTECKHPDEKHTIWWWIEDGDPVPVPKAATFDNMNDAVAVVKGWLVDPPVHLRWVKIFRYDNETYTCFQWKNDTPYEKPEEIPPIRRTQPAPRRRWTDIFRR